MFDRMFRSAHACPYVRVSEVCVCVRCVWRLFLFSDFAEVASAKELPFLFHVIETLHKSPQSLRDLFL